MNTRPMSEETRQLLRRVVESLAWRQIASMNILGHCLKFVGDLETKMRLARELELSIHLFQEVRTLYAELGWTQLESAVRDRLEDLPYPASRLEFGAAHYLTGLAERVAMEAYTESALPQFAAIARSYVDASGELPEPERFLEFCREERNRSQARQHVDRWLAIAIASLGRPGTATDARAVELGLRTRTAGAMQATLLGRVRPFLERCGLTLPDLAALGVEVSADASAGAE